MRSPTDRHRHRGDQCAALAPPIAAATEAGIPVIVIDFDANTDKYVTFLATNNETGGKKAADEIARCIKARTGKAEGKVAYLTALAGAHRSTTATRASSRS